MSAFLSVSLPFRFSCCQGSKSPKDIRQACPTNIPLYPNPFHWKTMIKCYIESWLSHLLIAFAVISLHKIYPTISLTASQFAWYTSISPTIFQDVIIQPNQPVTQLGQLYSLSLCDYLRDPSSHREIKWYYSSSMGPEFDSGNQSVGPSSLFRSISTSLW